MKKFISALSSLAIAATAMGGAMAYAATNGDVPASTPVIVDIQSGGSNSVQLPVSTEVTQVPVTIYMPQNPGLQTIAMKLQINDGEPGKGWVLDMNDNVVENHPASMGNYGFTIDATTSNAPQLWRATKMCLDSGYFTDNPKHAGYYNAGGVSTFVPESFNISYIAKAAVDNESNIDSYCAWKAAGEPDDYASYTPVSKWTKDEAWAYDAPFIEFKLNVPGNLAEGKYVLDLCTEVCYNTNPSSLYYDDGSARPQSEWDTIQTRFTGTDSGSDSVERQFESVPLTIQIGDSQGVVTTPAPDGPTTTPAPDGPTTTPAPVVGEKTDIVYDLVPSGKDYEAIGKYNIGNNVYHAQPGEEIAIDWRVQDDAGTAGMQMYFDFSELVKGGGKYTGHSSKSSDYMFGPTYNDNDANTTGQVVFTFGQQYEEDPVADGIVHTFNIVAPEDNGSYTIGLDSSSINKVIPLDQDNPYSFTFHGLTVVVGEEGVVTTPAPSTTPAPTTNTTPAPSTTPAPTTSTTPTPVNPGEKLLGDVNCDGSVKINDVVLLNRWLAGTKNVSDQGLINADTNQDGKANSDDATEIKEYLARLNLDTTKVGTAG